MDDWKLVQYNKVVDSFFDSLSINKQGNLKHRLATLLELGNECRESISKFLGDGFYELKAKADRKEIRLIYFFRRSPHHRTICFVHAFIKKPDKQVLMI